MVYYHSSYGPPSRKKSPLKRIFVFLLIIIILAGAGLGYFVYGIIYKPNVWTPESKAVFVKIPTGTDFVGVKNILYEKGLIIHRNNFEWVAEYKGYTERVKPGNYKVNNGLSNNDLIDLLRSGNQEPVMVMFNNNRDIYHLASRVSTQIETDSASIVNYILSEEFKSKLVNDSINPGIYFIPNTYEFYWNTSAQGFTARMLNEYDKFWNGKREDRAKEMNMSIEEVIILASIVEKETQKTDEKPIIAGVYLNRLERKWLLQADPTLLFILNDPNIKRVLNAHMLIDSPYNTYKYGGLPPGPICIPSVSSIDAVLNSRKTDYLFFCAKDDLSGYHVFAKTNREHNKNAKKYREALNKLKIYK